MSKIKKSAPDRLWTTYNYVLWTDKIHCFITLTQIKLLGNQICAYLSHVSTHTYSCSKESVQVFKQKL